ncbi:DUF4190 domain-containing protein [Tsukamurella paurometabola]|uniref:DUF4190 domain-containing protein n=1 Tax=Tsukamurella paurometabola (strain ATCC 8368 / DSM 20162 / CCUG 35730 / CIP 100753 / JCM 10117 / KCTC 9821 / NBRC 16120 / NCIMB 702349 / NCTC 13040) TaxID=521096 RepID=D5UTM7_TSUPD|nr:DUF4190 domain-containing protein [Tsukamurella paurometabola]ADG77381.1 conserved hypothetical protein [Tsukamurella paurometabola DSM 20162]SUP26783.1 Uncharacterised protein [Tsukamurella paurometabola]
MTRPEYDPSQPYAPYGSPGYPSPGYPQHPGYPAYPGYPVPPGEHQDPDNALGIVGLILSVAGCSPVGLVVSWIALNKSRQRGYKNTLALVGAIIGGVFTGFLVLVLVFYVVIFALALSTVGATSLV